MISYKIIQKHGIHRNLLTMEFEFPSILIVVVSFSLLIFMVLKSLGWNSVTNSSPLDLIPGPREHPLIGDLHLLVGNPLSHHAFKDLADKYGPMVHLQLGEVPFLIVSFAEVAKQILKTYDVNFANRPTVLSVKAMSYNYTDIAFAHMAITGETFEKFAY